MKRAILGLAMIAFASVAGAQEWSPFARARSEVRTSIHFAGVDPAPLPTPPSAVFSRITYDAPSGQLGAYVTPDPGDGRRHPAIIWMTGGETNTVGDVWSPRPRDNDQSAAAYREAGIVMMFPSLRGGNDNPGQIEGLFGEIDDVLAAAEYLAQQSYVDPQRIYLGGHSTGGTLVFLTAAASSRFRAVFSFGPVTRASRYGEDFIPFNFRRLPAWEERLRAPIEWMDSVRSPLFVIEGRGFGGNDEDLRALRDANTNASIRFVEVLDAGHFSVLAPMNELIARAIIADTGSSMSIEFATAEVEAAFRPRPRVQTGPSLVRQPTGAQLNLHYPPAARAAGIEGAARVSCVVQNDFRLDQCEILSEEPAGHGFGEAAVAMMRTYMEVAPLTPDGTSTVGGRLVRQFRWFQ